MAGVDVYRTLYLSHPSAPIRPLPSCEQELRAPYCCGGGRRSGRIFLVGKHEHRRKARRLIWTHGMSSPSGPQTSSLTTQARISLGCSRRKCRRCGEPLDRLAASGRARRRELTACGIAAKWLVQPKADPHAPCSLITAPLIDIVAPSNQRKTSTRLLLRFVRNQSYLSATVALYAASRRPSRPFIEPISKGSSGSILPVR